ncbi:MAG: histidine kinase [Spirochaetales bacterium]|nr:histidine kinase [Spirochaetales bacterium]
MKKQTVQRTLFFSYFIPILITIFSLSVMFFSYTSRVLTRGEESNLADITDKMVSIIDGEISKMNRLSLNITNSMLLRENIKDYLELTDEGFSPESREIYLKARDISSMLAMITGPIKTVPQINYIDPESQLIGSGTYNLIHEIPVESLSTIELVDREFGKRHFSGPSRDPLAEKAFPIYKNKQYISLYRTIFDDYMKKPVGIIEVKQFAETIFYGFSKTPQNFLIFDSQLRQLFPYRNDNPIPYATILGNSRGNQIVNFRNPETGEKEILSIGRCKEINWVIMNVVNESELLSPVYRFLLIIIFSGILILTIGTAVARRLSRLITSSLLELNGWISNLHWDSISSDTAVEPHMLSPLTEFEKIHRAFWKMNRKLSDSMKQVIHERTLQENARMLALQSQMDPHFMYNMLTTISIMAEDGESENIVETISYLTSMLRYTASSSHPNVPLTEEAEVSRSYLTCMKIRHGDDLKFDINIDERLEDLMIPKLIILPLVENSIKYATCGPPPWMIKVSTAVDQGRWKLSIEDSGPGFSDEALENIQHSMRCCTNDVNKQLALHIEGLGIINIYSRLIIFFKEDLDFDILTAEAGGARIVIGGKLGEG